MECKHIVFRFDSGTPIGFGHAYRCYSLGEYLKKFNFKVTYLTRRRPHSLVKINGDCFDILPQPIEQESFDHESNWLGIDIKCEVSEVCDYFKDEKVDVFFIDHYGISGEYEKLISKELSCVIGVIDDYSSRKHFCHYYINQNISANPSLIKKSINKEAHLFVGPQYCMLRDEFYNIEPQEERQKVKDVLVFLGGSLEKESIELAQLLDQRCTDINIHLLMSEKRDIGGRVKTYSHVKNMSAFLKKFDFIFGGAGSSSWERGKLAICSGVFVFAENQVEIAQKLHEVGLAHSFGWFNADSLENAVSFIEEHKSNESYILNMKKRCLETFSRDSRADILKVLT